jgi:hypothetical protein
MSGSAYAAKAARSSSVRVSEAACVSSSPPISASLRRSSFVSPSIRRRQRSRPPITAASTSRRSQRRGALSCPSRTGASGAGAAAFVAADAAESPAFSGASAGTGSGSGATQRSPRDRASGATPVGAASGTWPSERYSANFRADSASAAHSSKAKKARPAGSGRTAPRAKWTGISARANASLR